MGNESRKPAQAHAPRPAAAPHHSQPRPQPAAPAPYRPQPAPKCLQLKPRAGVAQGHPFAPPAGRTAQPTPTPRPAAARPNWPVRQPATAPPPSPRPPVVPRATAPQMKTAQPAAYRPAQPPRPAAPIQPKAVFPPRAWAAPAAPAASLLQRKVAAPAGVRQARPGAVVQRLPSNNNDPTSKADGLYMDRQAMTQFGSYTVPQRITGIMKDPDPGTVPSVSPPGWSWLQKRYPRLKGHWVRFHIINRLLGGPGNRTWNLVPTSVAVNNHFSQNIEEDAKASARKRWTYVDVQLHYNPNWPAPIPERITGEWGRWDDKNKHWVMKRSVNMNNPDITQIGNTVATQRGTNITLDQLVKTTRNVPGNVGPDLKAFLRDTRFTRDSERALFRAAKREFGDDAELGWLDQVWLDEAETPDTFQAVVKKFKVRQSNKRKARRDDDDGRPRKKRKKK